MCASFFCHFLCKKKISNRTSSKSKTSIYQREDFSVVMSKQKIHWVVCVFYHWSESEKTLSTIPRGNLKTTLSHWKGTNALRPHYMHAGTSVVLDLRFEGNSGRKITWFLWCHRVSKSSEMLSFQTKTSSQSVQNSRVWRGFSNGAVFVTHLVGVEIWNFTSKRDFVRFPSSLGSS